jgi:23S rRNA (uridine2552-2'-O)-methyltransferase
MAPKLSGVRATDEVRAAGLAGLALVAARSLLRPGGRLLVKLFAGSESDVFVEDLKSSFAAVKLTRPQATRSGSSELYAVALGYHG